MKPLHKMSKEAVYLEGIRKGKEAAAEAVANVFQTGLYLALAGYYNTKPDKAVTRCLAHGQRQQRKNAHESFVRYEEITM